MKLLHPRIKTAKEKFESYKKASQYKDWENVEFEDIGVFEFIRTGEKTISRTIQKTSADIYLIIEVEGNDERYKLEIPL
ncbi:hypothetical protein [Caminibacter sp.]